MGTAEQRLDGAIAYRSLVRYDAYGEMSGRQSTSIALLDASRSGIVLSSIHHRDQARLYAKQIYAGRGELELSPEENEAIRLALEGGGETAASSAQRLTTLAMRVGYFGPEGTFTHEALIASSTGAEIEAVPLPTIYDTVMAVHSGHGRAGVRADRELARGVRQRHPRRTRDGDRGRRHRRRGRAPDPPLPDRAHRTRARADRGRHLTPTGKRAMRALHPHPAAGRWVLAGSSTAEAVRQVAAHDGPWAALGNRAAAERYGCHVLRAGVEDVADNETRFVWLGPAGAAGGAAQERGGPLQPLGPWKTAVVFWGIGSEAPGWLVGCLAEFASRDVNLTRIESRPRKQGLGRYMFFCDLEGRDSDPRVNDALEGLRGHVERLRVLGSYPAA